MSDIIITGHKSKIAQEFTKLVEPASILGVRCEDIDKHLQASRYLFCQGYLAGKSPEEISAEEFRKTMDVNYVMIANAITTIIGSNPFAKICVITSYSGYKGSYDTAYASSKRLMNDFIDNVKLSSRHQQVVGIAPWIVQDAGMTVRREDKKTLTKYKNNHPLKRFSNSDEVAALAYDLLFKHRYINNTVIKMHGGGV